MATIFSAWGIFRELSDGSRLISAITGFIQTMIMVSALGSGICLVAGEVRLASLKLASKGSAKFN
jgi:hypothetical protein